MEKSNYDINKILLKVQFNPEKGKIEINNIDDEKPRKVIKKLVKKKSEINKDLDEINLPKQNRKHINNRKNSSIYNQID